MAGRVGVLLVQLGTPDAPETGALRRYLAQFLSDRRVVDLPRWQWLPLLHGVILRKRPARSAALYRRIWRPEGSPLRHFTELQTRAVAAGLGEAVVVRHAMRYGSPAVAAVVAEMMAAGVERLLCLPLFPQYASSTVASVVDAVYEAVRPRRYLPALRVAAPFPDDPGYIAALAASHGNLTSELHLFSFHGQPQRYIRDGDPYADHCFATARALAAALGWPESRWRLAFQSRFGREPWIGPETVATLAALPGQGVRRVSVSCPGFVSDCLETLEEIAVENRRVFLEAGGERFEYVGCVNDGEAWLQALTRIARRELGGWLETGEG